MTAVSESSIRAIIPKKVLKYDSPHASPRNQKFHLVCHDKTYVAIFFIEIVWEYRPDVGYTYIKFPGRHIKIPRNGQRIIVGESPMQLSVFKIWNLTVAEMR